MRFTPIILLAGAASAAVVSSLKCNANNCLRAVRATAPVFSTRKQSEDCSLFLKSYHPTVTAKTVHTPASTTTTTIQTHGGFDLELCTPLPSVPSMPTYATPCSGASAFSSACACIGITEASPPTAVTITIATATATTTTAIATIKASEFHLKIREEAAEPRYVRAATSDDPINPPTVITTNISQAVVFSIHNDGTLRTTFGLMMVYTISENFGNIYLGDVPEGADPDEHRPYDCDITSDKSVSCATDEVDPFMAFGLVELGESVLMVGGKASLDWDALGTVAQLEAVPIIPNC
ncbi:hypothetical protein TWF718_008323 [Orbilia javanica]|uniref:Uncharacterized protein n=1 Tax=Orbilia javanica TaxID=47235 RepID=A0AAN8N0V6_9PEZI